jgi:hypothetical protein
MSLRAFLVVPPVTLGLLASPGLSPASTQSVTLRIELLNHSLSHSRHAFSVSVTTGVFGDERKRVQRPDTVLQLPASMDIADSIRSVRVVVTGFAAVRVTLTGSGTPGDSLVSIGRDITLSRKPKGPFTRVWTVQPLIP